MSDRSILAGAIAAAAVGLLLLLVLRGCVSNPFARHPRAGDPPRSTHAHDH